MPFKLGVTVALSVAWLLVGGAGTAEAAPTTPPTPPLTCPPILPISGAASSVTPTSATISYSIFLGPPCGYDPPVTVGLFADHDDAQQWLNPVAEAVSGPESSGQIPFDGLTPDTVYWFRFAAGAHRDPYVFGSFRTAPLPVCTATAHTDSDWNGGFVATVTVRNTGNEPLDTWHVSWQWPGDERIQAVWNGVAQSGAVGNAPYNGMLPPGGSTTFGMLVATSGPPPETTPSCAR